MLSLISPFDVGGLSLPDERELEVADELGKEEVERLLLAPLAHVHGDLEKDLMKIAIGTTL